MALSEKDRGFVEDFVGRVEGTWELEKDRFELVRTDEGGLEVLNPDGTPSPLGVGKLLLRGRKVAGSD